MYVCISGKVEEHVCKDALEEKAARKEHAVFYRQLCEECPHLICFLGTVCKFGKPKSVLKKYSLRTKYVAKPETRNALCTAVFICVTQYNQKLTVFHQETMRYLIVTS